MKKVNNEKKYTKIQKNLIKERCFIGLSLMGVILFFLIGRLTYIMVFKSDEYKSMANEQWVNEIKIDAKRGKILDRNGYELAVSGDVYRIDLDLKTIRETYERKAKEDKSSEGSLEEKKLKQKDILAEQLAKALEIDKKEVLLKLDEKLPSGVEAQSSILARKIEKDNADAVKALNYYGVLVSHDTKRYYPNDEFSSYIIGNVNSDNKGLSGIEHYYDSILSGIPGVRIAEVSKVQEELPLKKSEFTDAVNGKDILLTIDEKIQYFSEKAAEDTLNKYKADSVSIIITDPNNGEILASTTSPDYNPNKPYEGFEKFTGKTDSDKIQNMWRNKIVSDTYEAGSTFKVITAAAGIEEGVADIGETYYCPGYKVVQGTRINCVKRDGHGTLSFSGILENSCNIGFMDIGEKLGEDKLYKYIMDFGFGKPTGVDLNGESSGIIMTPEQMSDVNLATVTFGQANTVSMLQLISAFNATINGGTLIQPHYMKEVISRTDTGARVINESFEPNKKSVISKETSDKLKVSLENVVEKGTAKSAYIEGYNIAGKTGTAEMVDMENGGYGEGRIASFIATAPANNPKVSVLVTIENPKSAPASGGAMAGPVVKELLETIFTYEKPEDVNFDKNKETAVMVPEVRGIKKAEAQKILNDNGFEVSFEGNGDIVKSMDIMPGATVKKGSTIKLTLTRGSIVDKEIIMPNMIGYTKKIAGNICEKIGLKFEFDKDEGVIRKQSVEPDKIIKNGDKIKFIMQE